MQTFNDYNPANQNKNLIHFGYSNEIKPEPRANRIEAFVELDTGNLYISTGDGFNLFPPDLNNTIGDAINELY